MKLELESRLLPGSRAERLGEQAWRLAIPPGPAGRYRGAQLDDYFTLARTRFFHRPPVRLELRARVSANALPGTWGFGLWNDPFGVGLRVGGAAPRLPALPNAAWFFYASPPNFLSLQDKQPAQGFLMAVFRSPLIPSALLLPGAPALALLVFPRLARWMRRLAAWVVGQDSALLDLDACAWHRYGLEWREDRVHFTVDGSLAWETPISPRGRLGLVIWIDNQFAAFLPSGRLGSGMLEGKEEAWMDVELLDAGE